jgi:hypothetical protein
LGNAEQIPTSMSLSVFAADISWNLIQNHTNSPLLQSDSDVDVFLYQLVYRLLLSMFSEYLGELLVFDNDTCITCNIQADVKLVFLVKFELVTGCA